MPFFPAWSMCALALSLYLSSPFLTAVNAADDYKLGDDSMVQEGVPKGELIKRSWTNSTVYPGTVRDFWIYVPKQYKSDTAACVMVFQDGWSYANPTGQFRTPVVFDNLIHKKEMP